MADSTQKFFLDVAAAASRESHAPITCTGAQAFGPTLRAGRFTLANGLTILLVPDMRAPIFAYQTWFRVGSKDEDPQRTGLAHLFEHLMFKGTRKYAAGTFDREMEQRGAQTNAATWVDWTYYTEALAVRDDNLATVIEFESDRMNGLVLDTQTFQSELEVVKNERRMSVEDSVVGTLSEHLLALAYTNHPYRWPTIGSMEHLESATLTDLEQFYRAYYAPNNATVVIVGAIDCVETLTLLARAYGAMPAHPVTRRRWSPEPVQQAPRSLIIERPLLSPQLVVGYHAPCQADRRFVALEMVGEALVSGDTARLHQRLVIDEQLATDVSGFLAPFAEPGLFEFHITVRSGAEPQRVLDVLQDELNQAAKGLSDVEQRKARHGLELALIDSLKDVEGCAEALGHHQTNYEDFTRAFALLEAYDAVPAQMLGDVAADVFNVARRSSVVAVPATGANDVDD